MDLRYIPLAMSPASENTSSAPETLEIEVEIRTLPYLNLTCLIIPREIVDLFGTLKNQRFWINVGPLRFQGGFMPIGDGCAGIAINKKRLKEAGLQPETHVFVRLERDHSEYGFDIPLTLQTVFDQDEEAFERFRQLKPGMQRYIIHYVASAKQSQTQIDRSLLLLGNLKKCKLGKETFRILLGK